MNTKEKILQDLKKALAEKNDFARDTLRLLLAEIKNQEISSQKRESGLSEEELQQVLRRAKKQREDSLQEYQKAGRLDLAKKEEQEIKLIEKYLPPQLKEEEIRDMVHRTIQEIQNPSNFGQVMGKVMPQIKGRADGSRVKKIIEEILQEKNF